MRVPARSTRRDLGDRYGQQVSAQVVAVLIA